MSLVDLWQFRPEGVLNGVSRYLLRHPLVEHGIAKFRCMPRRHSEAQMSNQSFYGMSKLEIKDISERR